MIKHTPHQQRAQEFLDYHKSLTVEIHMKDLNLETAEDAMGIALWAKKIYDNLEVKPHHLALMVDDKPVLAEPAFPYRDFTLTPTVKVAPTIKPSGVPGMAMSAIEGMNLYYLDQENVLQYWAFNEDYHRRAIQTDEHVRQGLEREQRIKTLVESFEGQRVTYEQLHTLPHNTLLAKLGHPGEQSWGIDNLYKYSAPTQPNTAGLLIPMLPDGASVINGEYFPTTGRAWAVTPEEEYLTGTKAEFLVLDQMFMFHVISSLITAAAVAPNLGDLAAKQRLKDSLQASLDVFMERTK